MPHRHQVFMKWDNFWAFAIFLEAMFATLLSSHRCLQVWRKKNVRGKVANCHRMLCKPSKNSRPTSAQSQLSTTPKETGPTHSSLMPASVTTKSQGPLMQSSHRSTQMVSIASLHILVESCKITNATTCHFYWKCKLPFGVWILLVPICKAESLHWSQITGP